MFQRNLLYRVLGVCPLYIAVAYQALLSASRLVDASTFVTFNDETAWQNASGSTVLEDFESFATGSQISVLPVLGVGFDFLAGGGYPNIYRYTTNTTPYGRKHLGNFPNGINQINRWDSISMTVLPGATITAVGYWNGDGQNDTLVAVAYDADGQTLGSVGALKGHFAGFLSSVPVARVVFEGNTGDGVINIEDLSLMAANWLR